MSSLGKVRTLSALVTVSVPSKVPAISAVSAKAVPSILPARVTSNLLDLTVPLSLPPTTAAAQPSVVPSNSTPSPITRLFAGGSTCCFDGEPLVEEEAEDEDFLRGGASDNAGPWWPRPLLPTECDVPFEIEPVPAAAAAAAADAAAAAAAAAPLGGRDCLNDESGDGPAASGVPP